MLQWIISMGEFDIPPILHINFIHVLRQRMTIMGPLNAEMPCIEIYDRFDRSQPITSP